MSYLDRTAYIAKFGGAIWYINKGSGSDSNPGDRPELAFETIGKGITEMANGDALSIAAGTYTELGLNLSNANAEMWFELGAIIDPASGTALTVSGNYCKVWCPGGSLKVTPAQDTIGVLISGAFCYVSDVRVACDGGAVGTSADLGFDITGNGCVLDNCRSSAPDIAAFKIQGDKAKLEDCCTGGNSGYSSIGFWATNSCDKLRIKDCGSQGHETSGFQIDAGCTNGVLKDCSSGGGDGRWSDADDSAVWSDFTYDDMVYHETDWSVVGGAAGTDNMFKITGSVQIEYVYGDVDIQIHADVDTIYLELDDGANQIDVTKKVAATDPNSAEVGSLFIKTKDSSNVIVLMQANQVRFNEDAAGRKGGAGFLVTQKTGANTYLRVGWTGTGNTGKIHWHAVWQPLDEDGFLEGV